MTTAAGRLRAPAGHQGSDNQVRQPLRAIPWLAVLSARLHDHITPLACEIQRRHQHGALGMKTAPRASLAFQGGQPEPGTVHHPGG